MVEFYFRFRFWSCYCQGHVILQRPANAHLNRTTNFGGMTSYRFSRWRPLRRKSSTGFGFGDVSHLRQTKSVCRLNVGDIPYLNPPLILLLPVSENKRHGTILEFYFRF